MAAERDTADIVIETAGKRLRRSERRELKRQAMLRYEKQRRRNLLATPGIHDVCLVLDHLKAGFNVAKIFRSAETFGAREIHLVGIGPFDPAPAKGAFKKVPARFHDDIGACLSELTGRGFRVFTLEPADTCSPLPAAALPRRTAFVLGHEEFGISFARARFPEIQCLSIPSVGTTESLNVSVAASIAMYEYVRQHTPHRQ